MIVFQVVKPVQQTQELLKPVKWLLWSKLKQLEDVEWRAKSSSYKHVTSNNFFSSPRASEQATDRYSISTWELLRKRLHLCDSLIARKEHQITWKRIDDCEINTFQPRRAFCCLMCWYTRFADAKKKPINHRRVHKVLSWLDNLRAPASQRDKKHALKSDFIRHTHQFSDNSTHNAPLIWKVSARLDTLLSNEHSSSMRGTKKIAAENNTRRELDKRVKRKRLKAKRLLNNISRWLVDFWLTPPIQWQWRARWDEKQRCEEEKEGTENDEEEIRATWNNLSFVRQITALSLMVMSKWAGGSGRWDGYLSSHRIIFVKQIFPWLDGKSAKQTFFFAPTKPPFHEPIINVKRLRQELFSLIPNRLGL